MVGNGRPTPPDIKHQATTIWTLSSSCNTLIKMAYTYTLHPLLFPKVHPWMLHSIIKLPHNESPVDTFFVQSNPNNHNTTTDDADAMPKQTKTGRLLSQQPRPNMIQQNPDDVLKWLRDVVNATDTHLYGIKE